MNVINEEIISYADDVTTIACTLAEEMETQTMSRMYNNASGGKTNRN